MGFFAEIRNKVPVSQLVFLLFNIVLWSLVIGGGILLMKSPDKWRFISAIPGPIRRSAEWVMREAQDLPHLSQRFKRVDLPRYDIRIADRDLYFLNSNLPKTGEVLVEANRVYVPIIFIADGKQYVAEMRYRGDSSNHWSYPKKSIRVKFSNDTPFEGKYDLNLIIPEDRKWLGEEINHQRSRSLGLLTPESGFAVLTINGARPALYWEVEQISDETMEKHLGASTDVFGECCQWNPLYTDIRYWEKFASDKTKHPDDFTALSSLLTLLNTAPDQEFHRRIFDLVDKENFYSYLTLIALSNTTHHGGIHNMRLYTDPQTKKLKFLTWDISMDEPITTSTDKTVVFETQNPLVLRMLQNPIVLTEWQERLWRYVSDPAHPEKERSMYDALLAQITPAVYQDRIREPLTADFHRDTAYVRSLIDARYQTLTSFFATNVTCRAGQVTAQSLSPHTITIGAEKRIITPVTRWERQILPVFVASEGKDQDYVDVLFLEPSTVLLPRSLSSVGVTNQYSGETTTVTCT